MNYDEHNDHPSAFQLPMSDPIQHVYSTVHRTFEIDEMVRHIFLKLSKRRLAAMVRVNKGLGNVALDILWKEVDVETLLYLFPRDAVTGAEGTKEKKFARPLLDEDWDRYVCYAPRVKILWRTLHPRKITCVNFQNVLTFLRPRGRLISLKKLVWNNASINEFPKILVFLVPTLKSVNIWVDRKLLKTRTGPGELSFEQQVEVPLQKLIDLDVPLKRLVLPVPKRITHSIATLYQTKWPLLRIDCLTQVGVIASDEFLHVLGGVPTLKVLIIHYLPGRDAVETEDTVDDRFPSLESLDVRDVPSLRHVTSFIRSTGCLPRSWIGVSCMHAPSGYKVSQFLDVVLQSRCGRGRGIQSFVLSISDRRTHLGGSVDDSRDDIEDKMVTLEHFRPLFALDMRHIHLDFGYLLSVSDEQLTELVSVWPGLRGLHLCTDRILTTRLPENSVSLHGLECLAPLAHIKFATLELNITQEVIESLSRAVSTELNMTQEEVESLSKAVSTCPLDSLEWFDVGGSYITNEAIVPVGKYLAYLFPNVRRVKYHGEAAEIGLAKAHKIPFAWHRVNDVIKKVHASKSTGPNESHPNGQPSPTTI